MESPPRAGEVESRFDGIDLLRGLSILAVVLLHISLRMRFSGYTLEPALPGWVFHFLFWNGNNGVTVFFAISGFLITFTSIRRFGGLSQFDAARFYRIRFARIGPLLLLLLGILSALHLAGAAGFTIPPQKASLPRALFSALTFHLNWLEAQIGYLPPSWDVLWSLSVEEMFYLGYPLACLMFRVRWGLALFLAVALSFIAAGPFARTVWTNNEIWREKSYLGGMDAIALGCLAALATVWLLQRTAGASRSGIHWHAVGAAGAGMMLLVFIWPPWSFMGHLGRTGLDGTALAAGTCLVMIASVVRGVEGSRWTLPLRWLGRHSYEVYLTHEFVVIWGTAVFVIWPHGPLALWFILMLGLSALLGAVVARYVSEPLNRMLRPRGTISPRRPRPAIDSIAV